MSAGHVLSPMHFQPQQLQFLFWRQTRRYSPSAHYSNAHNFSGPGQVRPSIPLDPTYDALIDSVDLSRLKQSARQRPNEHEPFHGKQRREIEEVFTEEPSASELEQGVEEDDNIHESRERKSPAAAFGSKGIGAVVLPTELQDSIRAAIGGMSLLKVSYEI